MDMRGLRDANVRVPSLQHSLLCFCDDSCRGHMTLWRVILVFRPLVTLGKQIDIRPA